MELGKLDITTENLQKMTVKVKVRATVKATVKVKVRATMKARAAAIVRVKKKTILGLKHF